jgi:hypothetical protein
VVKEGKFLHDFGIRIFVAAFILKVEILPGTFTWRAYRLGLHEVRILLDAMNFM